MLYVQTLLDSASGDSDNKKATDESTTKLEATVSELEEKLAEAETGNNKLCVPGGLLQLAVLYQYEEYFYS